MTRRKVVERAVEVLVPVAVVAIWWAWSASADSIYFPPVSKILTAFNDTWLFERFGSDVVPSLRRMLSGYVIGVVLAIAIGFALGLSPLLRRATGPVLHFLRSLPAPALLPFAMVVFGIGDGMKVALIAFGSFFPVLLSTIDGVRAVDPVCLDAVRVYGIGRRDRLLRVMLPAASPMIVAGMRTSLALALLLIVISEMVASTSGIGYFVLQAQRTFLLPEMWAGMLLLGLLGFALNGVFVLIERRALLWHRGARAGAEGQ